MIYTGKNIRSNADALQKQSIEHLYKSLCSPAAEVESLLKRLYIIRGIDNKQYSEVKRTLPYFVCGCFNPPFRKTENFAYIEYFVVDVDHITMKGFELSELKNRLKADARIVLMFVSPSGDGLKLLFRLKERCYDSGIYSLFYKAFVKKFSSQYGLEQVVDAVTSDVTRACFVSMDRDAFYNPNADPVHLDMYIDTNDTLGLFDAKKENSKEEKELQVSLKEDAADYPHDPDKMAMQHILNTLAGKRKPVEEKKKVFVPLMLDEMIDSLKQFIEDQGVSVYEVLDIQYAKKIRCKLGGRQAEINLFYGKRGFNVVQSPRTGTSEELNQVVAEIINIYIQDHYK